MYQKRSKTGWNQSKINIVLKSESNFKVWFRIRHNSDYEFESDFELDGLIQFVTPNCLRLVSRITKLSNNAVCWVSYENTLELDLGPSEWPNLLLYTYCIAKFWLHWYVTVWVGYLTQIWPITKFYTTLELEALKLLTFINTFLHLVIEY